MNRKYGKPVENSVEYGPDVFKDGDATTFQPLESTYNAHGYYRMANNQPTEHEGYNPVVARYEIADGKCMTVWDYAKKSVDEMVAIYDGEMEAHITATREARGYTTREPSAYAQSTNPRFAQDARDWAAFIDAVMAYGLEVQNTYAETGVAPTIAEFKANLPQIHWTVEEA